MDDGGNSYKKIESLRDKKAKELRQNLQIKLKLIKIWQNSPPSSTYPKLQSAEHVKKYKWCMMEEFKRACIYKMNLNINKNTLYMLALTKELILKVPKDCKTDWLTEMSSAEIGKRIDHWRKHAELRGSHFVPDDNNPEVDGLKQDLKIKEDAMERLRNDKDSIIQEKNDRIIRITEREKASLEKLKDEYKNIEKKMKEERDQKITEVVTSRIAVEKNELRNSNKRVEELESRLKQSEDAAKERYQDMVHNLRNHIKSMETLQKEERETFRNEKKEMGECVIKKETELREVFKRVDELKEQLVRKTYRTNQEKGDEGEQELQNMLQTCVGDSYDIKDVHGNPHEMDLRIQHLETGTKIIFDAKNYKDNISISRQNDFFKDGKSQHKLDSKICAAVLVSMNTKMVSEKRGVPRLGIEWTFKDGMFFVWLSEIRKYHGRLEGAISLLETLFSLPDYDDLLKNKRLKGTIDKLLHLIDSRHTSNVNRMKNTRKELNKQIKDENKYADEIKILVSSMLLSSADSAPPVLPVPPAPSVLSVLSVPPAPRILCD